MATATLTPAYAEYVEYPDGSFLFRAHGSSEYYAVSADGDQSPSFGTRREAGAYLVLHNYAA